MARYVVLCGSLVGLIVGAWLLAYGYSAGIRRRRILADHSGGYDTGRRAVVRGTVYCVLGALVVGPCALVWASFVAAVVRGETAAPEPQRWRYEVEGGVAKSTRGYLLVAHPGAPDERRVEVVSSCSKPLGGEAVYGRCQHAVEVRDRGGFSLETGEEVVFAYAGGGGAVLATVEHGCCGGLSLLTYYSLAGERLGIFATRERVVPIIDRTWDLANVADRRLLLLSEPSAEPAEQPGLVVLERDPSGAWKRERLRWTIAEPGSCPQWFPSGFAYYGDTGEYSLELSPHECDAFPKRGPCRRAADGWSCAL